LTPKTRDTEVLIGLLLEFQTMPTGEVTGVF